MRKKCTYLIMFSLLISCFACQENLGKVDQGRVIEFDKEKGILTMIRDQSMDSKNPDYSLLPPVVYEIPKDPNEMGAEPKAGKRIKLDTKKNQIIIYVPDVKNFATINYTLVEQKENVDPSDSLVFDKEKNKAKQFPAIDKEKKTITIYSKRQKVYTTFSVPNEYFAFPESTWDNGDEVRIYYKEEGKAKRLMNVTKTDIYKK